MATQENAWASSGSSASSERRRSESPRALQNDQPCVPAIISTTFTSVTTIPATCLPIPEGATIDCRQLTATGCTTGTPEVAGPGLIEVPVTIGVAPNTIIIRDAGGAIICTIPVTNPSPITGVIAVNCPNTAGVRCTCTATIGACLSCTFNADRTATVCTHRIDERVDCASFPPTTPPPPPGPCLPAGCPPATEIVCILVDKVYDFCFESDTLVGCTPIPISTCPFPLPSGATAECNVDTVACKTGMAMPTGVDGFAALPVTVTVTSTVTIRDFFGNVLCSFPSNPVILPKTIVVCSPPGVACDCFALVSCGNCTFVTPGGVPTVCCSYSICTIVECTAAVKLLVPSFGFCVPTRCVPRGFPPGQCPPTNLFPPQCTPFD